MVKIRAARGWVKNVKKNVEQCSNENTVASGSWVMGAFAAKSWPYILNVCEAVSHFGRQVQVSWTAGCQLRKGLQFPFEINPSLRVCIKAYINSSLSPGAKNYMSHKTTFQGCLRPATMTPRVFL